MMKATSINHPVRGQQGPLWKPESPRIWSLPLPWGPITGLFEIPPLRDTTLRETQSRAGASLTDGHSAGDWAGALGRGRSRGALSIHWGPGKWWLVRLWA